MGTDQITKQIDEALAAVNASGATDDFKLEAFRIVLRTLLGQTGSSGPAQPAGSTPQPDATTGEEWQLKIANRLKISTEQVAAVYHKESDDVLRLMLDTSVLSKNKQTADRKSTRLNSSH